MNDADVTLDKIFIVQKAKMIADCSMDNYDVMIEEYERKSLVNEAVWRAPVVLPVTG